MHGLPFIDAHVHFWDLARLRYPWLTPPFADDGPNGSVEAIAATYLPADYRAEVDGWNMVGAVHVDAGADPGQAPDETAWLEEQAAATGLPSAIVAHAALEDGDAAAQLAAQARHGRVRGIRQIVNWHLDPRRSYTPRDLTRDERWQRGFALLARFGLSFDLQCYPAQVPALVPLLARHPATPVILNHLGMPVLADPDGLAEWRAGLRALAALPQVSVKLSGLGFVVRAWTEAQVLPLLEETAALFGADRCMIASDLPTDRLFAPAEAYRATYARLADGLSGDERRDLFARTANRVYRLGLDV